MLLSLEFDPEGSNVRRDVVEHGVAPAVLERLNGRPYAMLIAAGVKVYPFKTVEANAVINSSIVWESRGARHLFGRMGVSGLANVDITPELATRVAMAFATALKQRFESPKPTPAG